MTCSVSVNPLADRREHERARQRWQGEETRGRCHNFRPPARNLGAIPHFFPRGPVQEKLGDVEHD